jgi:hypothetical protein
MKRVKLIATIYTFLLCFFAVDALAQTTLIKGIVTDAKEKDPLPYVTVLFKGTSIMTRTDADGRFTISTTAGHNTLQLAMLVTRLSS